ncbi:hypothetical protein F5Y06DRAFT_292888 [Hypoxylon sp. FL0890]|nr:hypothetical protein F5Y06DRAFT_292888 [Hypoxylon sp. FL0890]
MKGYSYLATHPNEQKPSIPYKIGKTFQAQIYHPPRPPSYFYKTASGDVEDGIRQLHPVQLCLRHPPAPGKAGNEELQLRVIHQIRVGDHTSSQIVVAQPSVPQGNVVLSAIFARPTNVVAKIYDPLYYDFDEYHPDPFANCDTAFAHETLAYKYLLPISGMAVPYFYGSYCISVPLSKDATKTRNVMAVLYEYIHGIPLQDIAVRDYTQQQRQAIMRAVIKADNRMWQLDVNNLDLHPRNVIVVSAEEGEEARIRIIDFDHCQCGTRTESGDLERPTLEPLPREQVLTRWLNNDLERSRIDFDWLVDWPWDEWLKEYASNTPRTIPYGISLLE